MPTFKAFASFFIRFKMEEQLTGRSFEISLDSFFCKRCIFFKDFLSQGSDSTAVFENIDERFVPTTRKMNNLVNGRDRFLDFGHDLVTEACQVEIYRFFV